MGRLSEQEPQQLHERQDDWCGQAVLDRYDPIRVLSNDSLVAFAFFVVFATFRIIHAHSPGPLTHFRWVLSPRLSNKEQRNIPHLRRCPSLFSLCVFPPLILTLSRSQRHLSSRAD